MQHFSLSLTDPTWCGTLREGPCCVRFSSSVEENQVLLLSRLQQEAGCPLLWPSSSSRVCRCHIFFICLSANGHLGCFHVLTVVNRAAMNGGGGGLVAKSCPTLTTAWTVTHQASLSMGFSRHGLPFPSPWTFPTQESKPRSPALQVDSLLTEV